MSDKQNVENAIKVLNKIVERKRRNSLNKDFQLERNMRLKVADLRDVLNALADEQAERNGASVEQEVTKCTCVSGKRVKCNYHDIKGDNTNEQSDEVGELAEFIAIETTSGESSPLAIAELVIKLGYTRKSSIVALEAMKLAGFQLPNGKRIRELLEWEDIDAICQLFGTPAGTTLPSEQEVLDCVIANNRTQASLADNKYITRAILNLLENKR